MKTLPNKPSPTTKSRNHFNLCWRHFCYWHSADFPESQQSLQFLVLYEYARESRVICEHVRKIQSLMSGSSITPQGGVTVPERLSQQRLMLSKYFNPYSTDFLLDGTFLAGHAQSKFATYENKWRKRGRPFPQLVQQIGNTFIRSFSLPKPGPRFDVIKPSGIRPDDDGHAVIECYRPVLPDGTDCVTWRNALNQDELKAIREEYNEILRGFDGSYGSRALVLEEAQAAIDAKKAYGLRSDCVAVLVKAHEFPATSNPGFPELVLHAARQALTSPCVSRPFIAFQTELIGTHHSLRLGADAGKAMASIGEADNIRVVVFPREALDSTHFERTEEEFHDTLFQHSAWATWKTEEPITPLLSWRKKELNAVLHRLWAFRYLHSVPLEGRSAFKNGFKAWRAKFHPDCVDHLNCDGKIDYHKHAKEAESYFAQIFPQAGAVKDAMWRKIACRS